MTGRCQAKDPQLAAYLKYVMLLKEAFIEFELVHVLREQNSRADLLAKLASSGKGNRQRSVIQENLKASSTQSNFIYTPAYRYVWGCEYNIVVILHVCCEYVVIFSVAYILHVASCY